MAYRNALIPSRERFNCRLQLLHDIYKVKKANHTLGTTENALSLTQEN